jgi:hypothetical protein
VGIYHPGSRHPVDDLVEACREELRILWCDLEAARCSAIRPGTWSIQCLNLEDRIKTFTKLVGPTPWEEIQISLLELGIYQRIHADLGVAAPVDMERVAQTRARLDERAARHG